MSNDIDVDIAKHEGITEDVVNSEAFKELERLLQNGEVGEERVERSKQRYAELHAALMRTMKQERVLLDQAKSLNRQLEVERKQVGSANNPQGEAAVLEILRDDVEQAETEASLASERYALVSLQEKEVRRQHEEVVQQVEEMQREQREALQPQIEQLHAEVKVLQEEVKQAYDQVEGCEREVTQVKSRSEQVEREKRVLEQMRRREANEAAKAEQQPVKAKRQVDIATSGLANCKASLAKLESKSQELNLKFSQVEVQRSSQQDEYTRQLAVVERLRIGKDAKERAADELQRDIKLAIIERERILAEKVDVEVALSSLLASLKREQEELSICNKAKDAALRTFKKEDWALKNVQDMLPPLQANKSAVETELQTLITAKEQNAKALEEVSQEVDRYLSHYLKVEALGSDHASLFQATWAEVQALERSVKGSRAEEQDRSAAITALASQRDRNSRQLSGLLSELKGSKEQAVLKHLALKDLQKRQAEVGRRFRDFKALYELVKTQRNKFVNLIQTARQSMAELREKVKLVTNEADILRQESSSKGAVLAKARAEAQAVQMERDHLRTDLNKLAMDFRRCQDVLAEQLAQLDKRNSILAGLERDILQMRKAYQVAVEGRNYAGLALIDRNDELCIMYEKAHTQEEVLKQGELELRRRDNESRVLTLQLKELGRAVEVNKSRQQQIPNLDEDVAVIQKQLMSARAEVVNLSELLTDPANLERWRPLQGSLPTKDAILTKQAAIEERLSAQREALLERDLILQELDTMAEDLRSKAAEGRGEALDLGQRMSAVQQQVRSLNRRLQATVSELSMTQAASLKLGAEKRELQEEVGQARIRWADGLPPTDDAEHEWEKLVREDEMLALYRASKEEMASFLAQKDALFTTALPRPNAYIPQDLGIPKPYSGMAPFKPSQPGATFRHIRKPQPQDVII